MDWPLGELIDSHEFLFILEDRRRARHWYGDQYLNDAKEDAAKEAWEFLTG